MSPACRVKGLLGGAKQAGHFHSNLFGGRTRPSFGGKNMVGQLSPRPLLPALGVGVIVAGNADPVFVDVVVTGSLKGDDHG